MKAILYALLLSIPHICLSNPSWLPIHPGYKYHYVLSDSVNRHLNSDLQNASTIRVMSSVQTNGVQICQLNTVLDKSTLRYRQPQFLQREMVIRDNGVIHFRNPKSIVVKTNTTIGESWLLDTLAGVTATQIATLQETLYGQTDSVRIFLLSSGDTIRLAKVHGLIQYPYQYGSDIYFRQVGISGLKKGFVPPDFLDCYDFEPGDRFEYRKSITNPYGGTNTVSQFSIIKRDDSFESGIRYEVKGFSRVTQIDHGNRTISYRKFEELKQDESEYRHLNYYNREGILNPQLSTVSAITTSYFMGHPDLISKEINIHDSQPMLCGNPSETDTLCCAYCDYPPSVQRQYLHGKGLGLISKWIGESEYTLSEELIAVKKKDFSFGEFTPVPELTENGESPSNTIVYPNPARNEVSITMTQYDQNSTLVLSDSRGCILAERSFSSGATLNMDMTNYAPGLYFYLIRDKAGRANGYGKIVKRSF